MEQVKIDRRTGSTMITMNEIKKRPKEHYLQLKREHGWSEDEMALSMKSSSNQNKNIKKGNKGRFFKGRCNHCGKYGHKKADCWDLKSKQESGQENERKGQKGKSRSDVLNVKSWVIMQMNAGMRKKQVGMKNMSPLP